VEEALSRHNRAWPVECQCLCKSIYLELQSQLLPPFALVSSPPRLASALPLPPPVPYLRFCTSVSLRLVSASKRLGPPCRRYRFFPCAGCLSFGPEGFSCWPDVFLSLPELFLFAGGLLLVSGFFPCAGCLSFGPGGFSCWPDVFLSLPELFLFAGGLLLVPGDFSSHWTSSF
jgi:hypothetical protein